MISDLVIFQRRVMAHQSLLARRCRGLVMARSPVLTVTATKFTAPTVKEAVSKKYQLNTVNYPLPASVNIPKHEVQRMKDLNREAKEKDNQEDLYAFNKLLTLQAQMESLKTKGFLRAYRSYTPPSDLRTRFLSCVSKVVETEVTLDNIDSIEISDSKQKFTLLKALNTEFDHKVHNSRLHMMKNLGDLYLFYQVNTVLIKGMVQLILMSISVSDLLRDSVRPAPRRQPEWITAGQSRHSERSHQVHREGRPSHGQCVPLPPE